MERAFSALSSAVRIYIAYGNGYRLLKPLSLGDGAAASLNLFYPPKSKGPALGGAFVYDLLRSYGFTVCVACAPLATATAALGRLEVANGVF